MSRGQASFRDALAGLVGGLTLAGCVSALPASAPPAVARPVVKAGPAAAVPTAPAAAGGPAAASAPGAGGSVPGTGATPTPTPTATASLSVPPTIPAPPAIGLTPPVVAPAPLAVQFALTGRVTLPASLIGNDGSTLVGLDGSSLVGLDGGSLIGLDGGSLIGLDGSTLVNQPRVGLVQAPLRLLEAAAPSIEVGLVDAADKLLPGTDWVNADATGHYQFASLPVTGGVFVQARVRGKTQVWTLGAVGKLSLPMGNQLDISPSSSLVADKTRVVLAEQDLALNDLALDRVSSLVAKLQASLTAADLPDFRRPAAQVAAALDLYLQKAPEVVTQAREVERNLGTPMVRVKRPFTGGIASPEHVAYDRAGNLFVAGLNDHRVWRVAAGSSQAVVFAEGGALKFPFGVACDAAGNVYVGRAIDLHHSWPENKTGGDTPGEQVFKIDPTGKTITPLAYTFSGPSGMAFAKDGKTLLVVNQKKNEVVAFDTEAGTGRVFVQDLPNPVGIAVDSRGIAYVTHLRADWDDPDSRKNGYRGAIAAIDLAGQTSLFYPGVIGTTGSDMLEGIAIDAADNLYVTNNWGNTIFKFTPKQKKIETFLKFNQPTGIAFDVDGDLVVTDYTQGTISRITP